MQLAVLCHGCVHEGRGSLAQTCLKDPASNVEQKVHYYIGVEMSSDAMALLSVRLGQVGYGAGLRRVARTSTGKVLGQARLTSCRT